MTAVPSGWTPEQARKRLEAATPGPWYRTPESAHVYGPDPDPDGDGGWLDVAQCEETADAEFIAHAPTDIAALLALLDDARETLEQIASLTPFQPPSNPAGVGNAPRLARAFLARFAADKDNP